MAGQACGVPIRRRVWGKLSDELQSSQPLLPKTWGKDWRQIGGGIWRRIIAPKTVSKTHDAYASGEAPTWAWPVYAFVVWLATIVGYIARFRRVRHKHRFKPDWRDSWEAFRQSEWLRDQLIAQGVAQLLSNRPAHLDDTKMILEPPAANGGPCPCTPFDMNRHFIALARWAANPEAIIRESFRRLARVLLAAHGSTGARSAATHEAVGVAVSKTAAARVALLVSSDRSERRSNHGAGSPAPAVRPERYSPLPTPNYLARTSRAR